MVIPRLLDYRTLFRQSDDVKNGQELGHNAVVYTYPDGSQDIICSTAPIFREPGWESAWADDRPAPEKKPRESGAKSEGENRDRSARRARAQLRRLALANGFRYFVTLTLDPARIDRYDPTAVTRALNQWCDNMVRRHGLRYILVPELHRDGAFHFHGFLAGEGLRVVDSGIRWDTRPVYNLPQWKYGYSTAQEPYGEYHAAVGYCCKYIGKQDGQRPLGRWYYSGGALAKPDKEYADLDYREQVGYEFELPGVRIKVNNGIKPE